jgi:hypothetical protein
MIALMLAISILPPVPLITSIIQTASGNGYSAPFGCPMMDGYACSYSQKAEAGWWVFFFMAVGGVLIFLGLRMKRAERSRGL